MNLTTLSPPPGVSSSSSVPPGTVLAMVPPNASAKTRKIPAAVAQSTIIVDSPNVLVTTLPALEVAPSLTGMNLAATKRASSRTIALLQRFGPVSGVYQEVYSPGAQVGAEMLETMLRVICGRLLPPSVTSYCKEVERYLDWLVGIDRRPVEVGPVTLCGYLRASRCRGSSVPTKVRAALCWCENHMKVQLGATGVEVRNFTESISKTSSPGCLVKEKDQAPPLPVEYVIALEGLVSTAHTLPLRVFAGVCCLCTHGVKRW